jgi:hypothetical protein
VAGNDDVVVTVNRSNIATPAKTKHATANAARAARMMAALLSDSASRMHISSETMDIDGEEGSSRRRQRDGYSLTRTIA